MITEKHISSVRHFHEEKYSERKVSEMTNYAFVLDANGKQLTPTKEKFKNNKIKCWQI